MRARPLRLRACRAARKFVRRRAAGSRGGSWLPIALRWRRVHAVATAGHGAMRNGVRAGAMHIHMHLRYAHQTGLVGGVRSSLALRASQLPSRASRKASRAPRHASRASTAPSRPVLREFPSTSTSSPSHATLIRVDHDETHRVIREYRTLRHSGRNETHRVRREHRDTRIGLAPQPPVAIPWMRPLTPQPAAGTRVIAALRAQAVPMLRPVAQGIDATESQRERRRAPSLDPRATRSQRTPPSQRMVGSAAQPPLSLPQSLTRLSDLVWRAPTPTMSGATTSTTPVRTSHSTIEPATRSAPVAGIETMADAPHVREALRAQVLDPALVERLADDVIRRIERRARIERERRGL